MKTENELVYGIIGENCWWWIQNSGIKSQGLLTAKYEFFENKEQNHKGQF